MGRTLNAKAKYELSDAAYRIVKLSSGAYSIHSLAHAETFHPVIGPVAEAQALYVRQLGLLERLRDHSGAFVVWDVGLGAAANALAVIGAARAVLGSVRLLSFDQTLEPLEFALAHPQHLEYLAGYDPLLRTLMREREVRSKEGACSIHWTAHLADFPSLLNSPEARALAKPHLIMFDAFSPAKNPSMWTLSLFSNLFGLLDPTVPCVLPTYSRSTILRVTLLLAGFFVGVGQATGEKEETTVAANIIDLIEEPLDRRWLERARRSTSAEPLLGPVYRQGCLSAENWEKLKVHLQFGI